MAVMVDGTLDVERAVWGALLGTATAWWEAKVMAAGFVLESELSSVRLQDIIRQDFQQLGAKEAASLARVEPLGQT